MARQISIFCHVCSLPVFRQELLNSQNSETIKFVLSSQAIVEMKNLND